MGVCCGRTNMVRVPSIGANIAISELKSTTVLDAITTHYEFVKLLGNGKYGVVRKARKRNSNAKIEYAVKSIPKEGNSKKDFKGLKRELEILRMVEHPNVIKLYEIYEDDKYVHIVTELCLGGDLFDYLLEKGNLTERESGEIMS